MSSVHCPPAPALATRILVVDDNADCADALALHLELDGCTTCTAYDGVQALQLAQAFRPEVGLIDISLPRLDGNELARRLREQPWGRDLYLIAVTGWAVPRSLEGASTVFNARLLKPFPFSAVTALLGARGACAAGGAPV